MLVRRIVRAFAGRVTEVSTRGKRRHWTAEQKRQIVAEGMEPGISAAMVARKHGISSGQFYAWRQQLVLRDAGTARLPRMAGVDAVPGMPHLEPAIPALSASGIPATAAAPVPPVQPDGRVSVTLRDGVAARLDKAFGVAARSYDRS